MLAKIVKVGTQGGVTKVKSIVKSKEGADIERVNSIAPEAIDQISALTGSQVDLKMKKQEDGSYIVVGINEEREKSSFGSKGGFVKKSGFTKAPEDPAKQLMIVKQNALGHATALAIHNSGGKIVSAADVIALAQPLVDFAISGVSATKIVGETVTAVKTKEVIEEDF